MKRMNQKKVVILGGYGAFGSLIAQELASSPAQIIIAGRNPQKGERFAQSIGAKYLYCDATNITSLEQAVVNSFLVINASGPFQASDYAIPETCIRLGCHYIDLGDSRDYVAGISQLHQAAQRQNLFVCVGASTSPAITSATIFALQNHLSQIESIEIALNAGNKNPAGISTIASILSYVGAPVSVYLDHQWQVVPGWSQGKFVVFPLPVGRRRVQLCNVPDLELFPHLFKAKNVIFRAGVELTLFNYAISILGQAKKLWPSLNLPALAKLLISFSKLFKSFGTFSGSCAVWVKDEQQNERSIAFVAPSNGPRIPTAPAVLLSRKLLKAEPVPSGAFPCVEFVDLDEYATYLKPFGISIVHGQNNVWQSSLT